MFATRPIMLRRSLMWRKVLAAVTHWQSAWTFRCCNQCIAAMLPSDDIFVDADRGA
jgi:hypothetical protein